MAVERTLVLVKPDGMQRHLAGLAIDRLENTHLELVGSKIVTVTDKLAREHYALLEGKGPFVDKKLFEHLINFIKGEYHGDPKRRVMALVYQGEDAVQGIRTAVGVTNPEDASPDTIRGAFGRICRKHGYYENVVHASGNTEEARREIAIWFKPDELLD
jgi:nucleoside-diphosphate kinase